jgi:hypothetical protein
MASYVEIIEALPDMLLSEKMVIRDLLIEQIGLPRPPMYKTKTDKQMEKERRGLLRTALKRLSAKDKREQEYERDRKLRRRTMSKTTEELTNGDRSSDQREKPDSDPT